MMRLSLVVLTIFLAACRQIHDPTVYPLSPLQAVRFTYLLGSSSPAHPPERPAAMLGVLATHHLAQTPTATFMYPSFMGILQQGQLLHSRPLPERGAQTSLEQLGVLIQTNVPDLLNRSANRADALNTYIDTIETALSEARIQDTLLQTFLDEIGKTFNVTKKQRNAEQKRQDKAMKNRQFAEAGAIQEKLLTLHRDLADIEFQKNEAEHIQELLAEMIEVSQKRLTALQENREILIAGLSVKELPGMDDLGILKTSKKRGFLR